MPAPDVLRARDSEPAVTNMELFFDLVYVFAVTQLSHRLLDHLSVRGAVETLVLFAAVWWAWNYTAWATNWIDPDRLPVRVLMIVLMLLSLVMSAAIPDAFGAQGWAFAAGYVAMQLVRSGFMVWAFGSGTMRRNFAQLLAWSAFAGVLWLAGAALDGDARLLVWTLAVVADWSAPLAGFWLPGAGRTPMTDWTLRPGHLAERCQLVVIIALGESILVTGQSFSELERTVPRVAAFVLAFAGSAALWWLYFARHSGAALDRVSRSADPARLGRGGYTYAHAVMVAGVIVAAVGDELVIAHPGGDATAATALTVLGGAALYLAGMTVFVVATGGLDCFERIATVLCFVALAAIGAATALLSPLALTGATVGVLLGLVAAAAYHASTSPRPAPA
jgi:low temperature requirement protein LtrA